MDKFLLVDGSSLLHRAYFALPPLTTRDGTPTGAVYGLCNMLLRLLDEIKPKYMLVAFDKSRKTFRTAMLPTYKGQRKQTPPELSAQFPLAMNVLSTVGIKTLEMDDYEADDIIGTIATHAAPAEAIIVTGDKDALQLIRRGVSVHYTKRGITDIKLYDEEAFAADYEGLTPLQLIDLKGLMGDASDNIPGVPGVGSKTALKLICEYGSVENVLAHAGEIKGKVLRQKLEENGEMALLSKRLATICLDVPGLSTRLEDYALAPVNHSAQKLLAELEFRNFYVRFERALGRVDAGEEAAALAKEKGRTKGRSFDDAFAGGAPSPSLGENVYDTSAQADLFLNMGEQRNFVIKEIAAKAEAEKVMARLGAERDAAEEIVWFTAETEGTASSLNFVAAELYADGQVFRLTGEAVDAFAPWLTCAARKGTAGIKEVVRTALAQKICPQGLTEDVMLAAYLDEPEQKSFAVETLAERYGLPDDLPKTVLLSRLSSVLSRQLEEKGLTRVYRELELPLAPVLAEMEMLGVAVDRKALTLREREMAMAVADLEAQARKEAGDAGFNPRSSKQLGVLLFEKLGLPVIKKTKSGYSTDASVLEELKGTHPLVDTIIRHRMLSKIHSTYLVGLKPLISDADGRIHTHFQQTATVTGRLSSVDPNLQNIPACTELGRGIRALFVPGSGYDWLLSCDYSQIELRVLAHIAGDPLLQEAFLEGQDIHARTAAEVFGYPLSAVPAEMRSRAKAVNFGIVYGISDFGLAKQIGVSRTEAAEFIKRYFERYPGIKAYMEKMVELARRQGYVTTLLGRRRYLPEIKSRNFARRSFAERTAINTPIQGTAADIMKLGMLRADEALKAARIKSRVLLQVHDELVLEVTEAEREQAAALVKNAMENAFKLSVPLMAEVNYGKNWAEAK